MSKSPSDMPRTWALQAAVLACASLVVFWGFYTLDHFALSRTGSGPAGLEGMWRRYWTFDPASLSDPIASLSGVNAAVFGIVITVVSIVLKLSAERYTGVARMFFRDHVNVMVAAYYVVACVVGVWLSASIQTDYVPRATLTATLCLTAGGLILMAPYFSYVFWFLEPSNIVERIRAYAVARVCRGAVEREDALCFAAQARTLFELEELTDIANNSISGKDKIIASGAVDALKDFALEYIETKPRASEAWLRIGPELRLNPDFVAMDSEALTDLEARRTWVEWKVMRQYLSIYNEALGSMRDINYLIAIDTRYIGEAAAKSGDNELINLVFRFLNSYLRATLNAKNIRTAYNVLHQYRKMLETMLRAKHDDAVVAGVKHMKYYGLVSFETGLSFVTETVAYDLSALAQLANEVSSTAETAILNEFLELDRLPSVRDQHNALMGVRKAQVKLATYYLATEQLDRARAIADDMREESHERLLLIWRQLANVENKDYWEIIDRGGNFEYMPLPQRNCLPTFFQWLGVNAEAA